MAPIRVRSTGPALLASVSVLVCLIVLAVVGASLERSRPSSPGAAATAIPPGVTSLSDPELVAWRVARRVASATDAGRPLPEVPSCDAALDAPTDRRCAGYEDALRDFLEDAREACDEPGHVRAEDFSCVPRSFFGGPRA